MSSSATPPDRGKAAPSTLTTPRMRPGMCWCRWSQFPADLTIASGILGPRTWPTSATSDGPCDQETAIVYAPAQRLLTLHPAVPGPPTAGPPDNCLTRLGPKFNRRNCLWAQGNTVGQSLPVRSSALTWSKCREQPSRVRHTSNVCRPPSTEPCPSTTTVVLLPRERHEEYRKPLTPLGRAAGPTLTSQTNLLAGHLDYKPTPRCLWMVQ